MLVSPAQSASTNPTKRWGFRENHESSGLFDSKCCAIGSPSANAGAMGSSAVGAKIIQKCSAGAIGSPAANAGAMGSSAV